MLEFIYFVSLIFCVFSFGVTMYHMRKTNDDTWTRYVDSLPFSALYTLFVVAFPVVNTVVALVLISDIFKSVKR